MEYIRKKRSLENYTIRSIPKEVLVIDSEGKINTPQFKQASKPYEGKSSYK